MRRIINLVKPVPSGMYILGYKISRFPDGQQGMTLDKIADKFGIPVEQLKIKK